MCGAWATLSISRSGSDHAGSRGPPSEGRQSTRDRTEQGADDDGQHHRDKDIPRHELDLDDRGGIGGDAEKNTVAESMEFWSGFRGYHRFLKT